MREPTGHSERITHNIRVAVHAFYIPEQSQPTEDVYFFAYRVEISNEGSAQVQLLSRHWEIDDGHGKTQEVRGPGVVGEQPVLAPGESFVYSSFCPLSTPVGSMQGTYQMRDSDEREFDVQIGQFLLAMPSSIQ